MLLEPVQGEGGVVPADDQYLRDVRALCDERGLLMMLDEIQTGFGRTGEWFGFQHAGVVPDVVTMAKAMGNGFPVGATWAKHEVAAVFQPGDHGSTYSGTALATAVVSAVIDEMRSIDAPGLAAKRGEYFSGEFAELPGIASVRGRGLLLAAELADGRDAKAAYAELLDRGLVTNAVTATSLRFAPPLTVTEAELDEAVAIVARRAAMRHLLNITDFTAEELVQVLHLAERTDLRPVLAGSGVALIFEKPSNRTRQSMEMAVVQLGGHPGVHAWRRGRVRRPRVRRGRHPRDGRLSRDARGACVRSRASSSEWRRVVAVPIVNMLSDYSHPLQALADALTMQQVHGPLAGHTVAYVGDYNNVARSLAEACVLLGANVALGCPVGYHASDAELERLNLLGDGRVTQVHRADEAVAGAIAVHTDTWTSMGQEAEKDDRKQAFEGYTVTDADDGAWPRRTPASTTASRRTAGTRWPPT